MFTFCRFAVWGYTRGRIAGPLHIPRSQTAAKQGECHESICLTIACLEMARKVKLCLKEREIKSKESKSKRLHTYHKPSSYLRPCCNMQETNLQL